MYGHIIRRVSEAGEKAAVWVHDLVSGETAGCRAGEPLIAASVIKLFIMAEAFRQIEAGALSPDEEFTVTPEKKMPSCGALSYMRDGQRVSAMDLIVLMIILSDNTATNMLIDRLTIPAVNRMIAEIGAEGCSLGRKLFDREAAARGVQNYVTAQGVGLLLRMIHARALVSPAASERMLRILLDQRLNGKIPFFLDCPVAHKTGEDSGISHDAAIVYAKKPFILVILGNEVNVPLFERLMQDIAKELAG